MKLAIPGMMAAALLLASPAFAQNYGSSSSPGASVAKDDQTYKATQPKKKKHMASQTRHHKAMKSRAQTTGSGSSSAPGASINKDDSTPKSK